jgi:integrase
MLSCAVECKRIRTGMRKLELRLLRRSALDLERKAIRLRPEDAKTGKARVVPLTERVAIAIRSLPDPIEGEHVFVNPETASPGMTRTASSSGSAGTSGSRAPGYTTAPELQHERASTRLDGVRGDEGDRARDPERLRAVQHRGRGDARQVIRRLEAGATTELARARPESRQDSVKIRGGVPREEKGPTAKLT